MLFTIFCCISTALCMYCILKRINKQSVDHAVHAAVHEVRREYQERNGTMVAQLAAKERELAKARDLVKLHEAVPTIEPPAASASASKAAGEPAPSADGKGKAKVKAKHPQGLDMFAMSRPFTDTSYDALMAVSDVVRVEPTAN